MSQLRTRKALKIFLLIVLVTLLFYEFPSTFVSRVSQDVGAVLHPTTSSERGQRGGNTGHRNHLSSSGRNANVRSDQPQSANTNEKILVKASPKNRKHMYNSNGLLETNLDGPHPIYELIANAQKEWDAKIARASTSLDEAVREYRRRYGRGPPKGFDDWWDFVQANSVQLPDEYDQIHKDLEAFWGLEPTDLQAIHYEAELKKDSYTIGKNSTAPTLVPIGDAATTTGSETHYEVPPGEVAILTWSFDPGRYKQLINGSGRIIDLLQHVAEWLPDFRMVITPHDGPNRVTDWGVKKILENAAKEGTYVARADLPKTTNLGWVSACAPDSPARSAPFPPPPPSNPSSSSSQNSSASNLNPTSQDTTSKPKTFIYNHPATMDICTHPHLYHNHGQFLSHHPHAGPAPQKVMVPEFGSCTTSVHHNIRLPTPYGWVEDLGWEWEEDNNDKNKKKGSNRVGEDVKEVVGEDDNEVDGKEEKEREKGDWARRKEERMLWRGSPTGVPWHVPFEVWGKAHRTRFVGETNGLEGVVQVLMARDNVSNTVNVDDYDEDDDNEEEPNGNEGQKGNGRVELKTLKKANLNPALFDVAFAGKPGNGCIEKGVCGELEARYPFRGRQSIKEAAGYKYVMDIDGNGWSGRFKRLITSNSLIFKATLYPEWFADRIAPWVHYVPVQLDLSDLYDTLIFFRGDANGEGGEEEMGRQIAKQSREWSQMFWREEDLVAYFWRLILEYARLMSLDREAMTYEG